jgi:hypothetical protein
VGSAVVDSVGGWVCERRGASEGGKKKKKWVGAGVDKKSDAVAALKFSLWVFFFSFSLVLLSVQSQERGEER